MIATSSELWPRLPYRQARARYELVRSSPSGERRALSRLEDPSVVVADEGRAVAWSVVESVRDELRAVADDHGWPDPPSLARSESLDRAWGRVLHDRMGLSPVQAAGGELWAYLALMVVPELAFWRAPDAPVAQVITGRDHVFGHLWWQQEVLGPDLVDGDGHPPLSQPDLARLFRRPAIVANPSLARAVVRGVLHSGEPQWARGSLLDAACHRLLLVMPATCFDILTEAELDELVAEVLAPPGTLRTAGRTGGGDDAERAASP